MRTQIAAVSRFCARQALAAGERWRRLRARYGAPQAEPQDSSWSFTPADGMIAAGSLVAVLAVCVPAAWSLHARAARADRQRLETSARCRSLQATIRHAEASRLARSLFRREVSRYVSEVETRPIVPWTTAVSELARNRPGGVWAVRLSGSGPNFTAQVRSERGDLTLAYAQRLRHSPFVDFAMVPAGEAPSTSAQVVGRLQGD